MIVNYLKTIGLILACLLVTQNIHGQTTGEVLSQEKHLEQLELADSLKINDGPYIFIENDELIEKNIIDGIVVSNRLKTNTYPSYFEPDPTLFDNVDEIAAFSDIHGQYDLAIKLLKNHSIIDDNLQWSFGKGHLVIVGDIFDRGDKATEFLWFVYELEKQAEENGGRVHYLLGNHEYMVLRNDLRYIHKKYQIASELLNTNYNELFSNQTILGKWLRSKPTIIKINDITFVHGGVSKELLSLNKDLDKINQLMRESIDVPREEMTDTSFYKNYYKSNGPIWYRGYFEDSLTNEDIDEILTELESSYIIVGHCSQDNIVRLFDGKIYGVDSSIKNGVNGELLLIKEKMFFRGTMDGDVIAIN